MGELSFIPDSYSRIFYQSRHAEANELDRLVNLKIKRKNSNKYFNRKTEVKWIKIIGFYDNMLNFKLNPMNY